MFEFIDSCRSGTGKYAYPVKKMCQWLRVSPSGFFDWKRRPVSATHRRRDHLKAIVREAFTRSEQTYGYRRVHAQLARWGVVCGPELIRDLMRELELAPASPGRPGSGSRPVIWLLARSRTWLPATSPPTLRGRSWSQT